MQITFLIIISIILVILLVYLITKIRYISGSNANDDSVILLQNQINLLTKQLSDRLEQTNERLNESNETINHQLSESNKIIQQSFAISNQTINQINTETTKNIKEITEKLTKLDQTNKQVVNFATQLQSLENILKNPKQRGILGEYFLESLLANTLPPNHYQMQYKFDSGIIVDAVIFVKEKIIPIDAKFSLEKFNILMEEKDRQKRQQLNKQFKLDIKNRIDETSKYIQTNSNTTEFAFMFIPAEGVFYNLLTHKIGSDQSVSHDLIEYAFSKKVIIVSPTSFFAYLQTVLQALKSLQVEESVTEVIKNVQNLDRHLKIYDNYMLSLGKNLNTVVNKYNLGYKEFKKIDKDISKITGSKSNLEPLQIDNPNI